MPAPTPSESSACGPATQNYGCVHTGGTLERPNAADANTVMQLATETMDWETFGDSIEEFSAKHVINSVNALCLPDDPIRPNANVANNILQIATETSDPIPYPCCPPVTPTATSTATGTVTVTPTSSPQSSPVPTVSASHSPFVCPTNTGTCHGCDDIVLLIHSDTTNESDPIIDSSVYEHSLLNPFVMLGSDPQHKTDQLQFGASSIYFDGSGGIEIPHSKQTYGSGPDIGDSSSLDLGTGPFTMEFWIRPTELDVHSFNILDSWHRDGTASQDWAIYYWYPVNGTIPGKLYFSATDHFQGNVHCGSADNPLTVNTWSHVAVVRDSDGKVNIYVDGSASGSEVTISQSITNWRNIYIGRYGEQASSSIGDFEGYLDEIRISKTDVYAGNFPKPSAPFGNCIEDPVLPFACPTDTATCPGCDDVVLLIQSDTTNESDDIIDSSSYDHSITALGDVHHEVDEKKYGASSLYFDGTGDEIRVDQTNDLNIDGDFTLEAWIHADSLPTVYAQTIASCWYQASGGNWQLILTSANVDTGQCELRFYTDHITNRNIGGLISISTWHHVAVVGSDDVIKMYIDGAAVIGEIADHDTYNSNLSKQIYIGSREFAHNGQILYYDGYLEDIRIVKGRAVYTSDFVRPSAPLSNCIEDPVTPATPTSSPSPTSSLSCYSSDPDCDDVMLLIQSDTTVETDSIIDTSGNCHTITVNGETHHEIDEKKFGASSLYFDGTGDYLSVPASEDWNFDAAFTIEGLFNFSAFEGVTNDLLGTANSFYYLGNNKSGWMLAYKHSNKTFRLNYQSNGSWVFLNYFVNSTALSPNTWYHIAVSRDSLNTVRIFLDGEQVDAPIQNTTSIVSTEGLSIGVGSGGIGLYQGHLEDIRISKSCIYTCNFTPPPQSHPSCGTVPSKHDCEDISLLIQSNTINEAGPVIDDSRNSHSITKNGNAHHETDGSRAGFGASALHFDGTNSFLEIGDHDDFEFGSGDFTMECWIWPTSGNNSANEPEGKSIFTKRAINDYGPFVLYVNPDNKLHLSMDENNSSPWSVDIWGTSTIPGDTWTHVAAQREENEVSLWVNGVKEASVEWAGTVLNDTSSLFIGFGGGHSYAVHHGYLNNIRIVKGVALYTNCFLPPTGSFNDCPATPTSTPTSTSTLTPTSTPTSTSSLVFGAGVGQDVLLIQSP